MIRSNIKYKVMDNLFNYDDKIEICNQCSDRGSL